MSEHALYARPLVVTEERIKAAYEKQMKQRALKEALDKQIEQTKLRSDKTGDLFIKGSQEVKKDGVVQRYRLDCEESGLYKIVQHDNGNQYFDHIEEAVTPPTNLTTTDTKLFGKVLAGDAGPKVRGVYNTNSLPPNFALSTSESNPLVPRRGKDEATHFFAGLPVGNKKPDSDFKGIPTRGQNSFHNLVSPKCSPEVDERVVELEPQATFSPHCFTFEEAKKSLPLQQQQPHLDSQSVAPVKSPAPGASSKQLRQKVAPNKHRGGPLPPLEQFDVANARGALRDPVPEKKGLTGNPPSVPTGGPSNSGSAAPQLKPRQPVAPRGRSREVRSRQLSVNGNGGGFSPHNDPVQSVEHRVEQLQKELMTRKFEMEKMREKEKNWEEQVKQLKLELKSAKKKEKHLNKLVNGGPKRAETAPDQPVVSAPVLSSVGPAGKKGVGNIKNCALEKKQKFLQGCVFKKETFRPISAPSDVVATSYVPEDGDDSIPAMQESFKFASFLTRKTTFGLHKEHANRPVPIEYEHLLQFVSEQIITKQQADALWRLFANEEPPLALLYRQPVDTPPLTKMSCLNSNCAGKVAPKRERRADLIAKEDLESIKEEKLLHVEVEEVERTEEDVDAEVKSLDFSDEKNSKEAEDDTFDTFAELHLSDYFHQEESDKEET